MKTYTSDGPTAQVGVTLPATLIDEIADAVADRLRAGDLAPAHSPWLDVPAAAAYLSMTPDAVRKAAQRGLLPATSPSGRDRATFFHHRELDEHLLACALSGTDDANGRSA